MRLVEPKKASTVLFEKHVQLPSVPVHIIVVTKYLISMIEIIARVHEAGIVHRDIKPDNFMLSVTGNTGESANSIEKKLNIIDFGLSRFYMKGDKHIDNTHDRSIVGTVRYISKHIHEGNVYSRRDDIISILYVAIYLAKGSLPWMGVTMKKGDMSTKEDVVYDIKDRTTSTELCEGIPYLFKKLLDYSYSLDFEDKPDYSYMTRQCKNYLKIYV
jgi:serine/threonine protein kinase